MEQSVDLRGRFSFGGRLERPSRHSSYAQIFHVVRVGGTAVDGCVAWKILEYLIGNRNMLRVMISPVALVTQCFSRTDHSFSNIVPFIAHNPHYRQEIVRRGSRRPRIFQTIFLFSQYPILLYGQSTLNSREGRDCHSRPIANGMVRQSRCTLLFRSSSTGSVFLMMLCVSTETNPQRWWIGLVASRTYGDSPSVLHVRLGTLGGFRSYREQLSSLHIMFNEPLQSLALRKVEIRVSTVGLGLFWSVSVRLNGALAAVTRRYFRLGAPFFVSDRLWSSQVPQSWKGLP